MVKVIKMAMLIQFTGKLRYFEFQGNGKNTSSFPKFEIANYDVTRIHVHEQKCVHFRLNRLSSFRKIGIAKNVCTFVIRCVLPTPFTHRYRGQIMGGLVQPRKLLDHFLNGILARKRHFRSVFSSLNVNKEMQLKFYLLTQSRIHL